MIGQTGLHRRCDAERLVNPAVVVVHEVKCDHRRVVPLTLALSPDYDSTMLAEVRGEGIIRRAITLVPRQAGGVNLY